MGDEAQPMSARRILVVALVTVALLTPAWGDSGREDDSPTNSQFRKSLAGDYEHDG